MCKPDTVRKPAAAPTEHPLLMLSLKQYGFSSPPIQSTLTTTAFVVAFFVATEMLVKAIFYQLQHLDPILENDVSIAILARHVGVDALGCGMVAWMGWQARHVCSELVQRVWHRNPGAMTKETHELRMYSYHPASSRIGTFFFSYQVKNLYDTLVWNDGPEFIFHHVLSLAVAWGALHPGCGHFYVVFFLGLSEISTAILCILGNFDDHHGVVGLGDAFPMSKVVVGILFVAFFILCRCILWPIASCYFVKDCRWCVETNSRNLEGRKVWIKLFQFSLCGLSVLQVAWLGQIYFTAIDELTKIGLIGSGADESG